MGESVFEKSKAVVGGREMNGSPPWVEHKRIRFPMMIAARFVAVGEDLVVVEVGEKRQFVPGVVFSFPSGGFLWSGGVGLGFDVIVVVNNNDGRGCFGSYVNEISQG